MIGNLAEFKRILIKLTLKKFRTGSDEPSGVKFHFQNELKRKDQESQKGLVRLTRHCFILKCLRIFPGRGNKSKKKKENGVGFNSKRQLLGEQDSIRSLRSHFTIFLAEFMISLKNFQ